MRGGACVARRFGESAEESVEDEVAGQEHDAICRCSPRRDDQRLGASIGSEDMCYVVCLCRGEGGKGGRDDRHCPERDDLAEHVGPPAPLPHPPPSDIVCWTSAYRDHGEVGVSATPSQRAVSESDERLPGDEIVERRREISELAPPTGCSEDTHVVLQNVRRVA